MLSAKPWKLESVLRLWLGVFFCFLIGSCLVSMMPMFQGTGSTHAVRRMAVMALSSHGLACALVYIFLREHGVGWSAAFGLRNDWRRALLSGAGAICVFLPIGLLLQAVSMKILEYFGYDAQEQIAVQTLRLAGSWTGQAAMAFIAIVLAPIAEEMLFRGILYPAIKGMGYPRAAWWGTSLFFAVVHFHLPSFLPLLLLAMLLTWLYERTDNLLASITAHSLFNTLNFVMLLAAEKFDQLPKPHP